MGVYNVHGGHNRIVPGAGHYLDEVTEDRKITAGVITLLQASGHTVHNCTDDVGNNEVYHGGKESSQIQKKAESSSNYIWNSAGIYCVLYSYICFKSKGTDI